MDSLGALGPSLVWPRRCLFRKGVTMIRRALCLLFGLVLVFLPLAPLARADGSGSEPACWDALDEVNALRAARGLPAYEYDPDLTGGAWACASLRAQYLCSGHTANDFAALPAGSFASAAGCAAWSPEYGWGSCCTYENCRYAGAAWAWGRDGRRYMSIFVRD